MIAFRHSLNSRTLSWLVVAIAMAAYIVTAVISGADIGWDIRNYHYYSGFRLLHGGFEGSFFPAQIQSWYNPVLDALTVFVMEHFPPVCVAIFLAALQSLALPVLFILIECTLTPLLADTSSRQCCITLIVVLLAGIVGPMTLSEVGTSFGDLTVSVLVLASLAALAQLFPATSPDGVSSWKKHCRWAGVAGFAAGLAIGLKLTCLIYMPGLFLMLLALRQSPYKIVILALLIGVTCIIGWSVTGGYWIWEMWSETGNPLFPFLNYIFHSHLLDPVNIADDARFRAKSLLDALCFAFSTAIGDHPGSEVSFADSRFAVALLSLPLLALRRPKGWAAALIVFFFVSFALWLTVFGIERYIVLLELLSGIVIALLIGHAARPDQRVAFIIAPLLFIVAFTAYPDWKNRMNWDQIGANGNWFNVIVPEALQQPHSLFILLGNQPASYVIPSFRPDSVFVRIGGNFMPPEHSLLYRQRADAINQHNGPLFTLSLDQLWPEEGGLMNAYGWYRDDRPCLPITTNAGTLWACPMRRKTS